MSNAIAVSRKDIHILRTPPKHMGMRGGLYQVDDPPQGRIHGLPCLVHDDHVMLENSGGGRENSLCRIEALVPERGYNDYCLFWIEKSKLKALTDRTYSELLGKIS